MPAKKHQITIAQHEDAVRIGKDAYNFILERCKDNATMVGVALSTAVHVMASHVAWNEKAEREHESKIA